jgi:hypothetical protein
VSERARGRRLGRGAALALAATSLLVATSARAGKDEAPAAASASLLSDPGTAVLGLGLLRVSPATAGVPGELRLRYEERPSDYLAFDAVQLAVWPAEAFRAEGRAFADAALAFARSKRGDYETFATVRVDAPALLVVGYGPFEGPDAGRPLTLARTVSLEVKEALGTNWRWVDAEAGELNVKGWTSHPTVRRGGPARDPVTGADHWLEARPLLLYSGERVRAPEDAEAPAVAALRKEAEALARRAEAQASQGNRKAAEELQAEAKELWAEAAASDERLPLPAPLAERLKRPPLRWK